MIPNLEGPISLGAAFAASVLGSLHCAGMCGGFVPLYSANAQRPLILHTFYNIGRLTTYLSLGLIAGALGSTLDRFALFADLHRVAALLVGLIMVTWGATGLLGIKIPTKGALARIATKCSSRIGQRLLRNETRPGLRAYSIGLTTTLLPCGWLYAFVALAGASGSATRGALLMGAFWLGTLPTMLGLGVASRSLLSPLTRLLPRIASIIILSGGMFALYTHFQGGSSEHEHCSMMHESE